MIIDIRNVDIFTELGTDYNVFAHGTNCCNTMAAGIAGQVAKRLPMLYDVDRVAARRGLNLTGLLSITQIKGDLWGANLYTQLMPGANARLSYIENSMIALATMVTEELKLKDPVIGIPKIGCGIGGLHWASVENVIERASGGVPVIVYDFDPRKV